MSEGYKSYEEFVRREGDERSKQERQQRLVDDITVLLETFDPESFSPGWIKTKDNKLCAKVNKGDIFTGWEEVVQRLDNKWQERWQPPALTNPEKQQRIISQLGILLGQNDPSILNPSWIKTTDENLYKRLGYHIRVGLFTDWQDVMSRLDQKWQDRWQRRQVGDKKPQEQDTTIEIVKPDSVPDTNIEHFPLNEPTTLEQKVSFLQSLLEKFDPPIFGPAWIDNTDSRLYKSIIKDARTSSGKVDWSIVLSQLGQKWQEKWQMRPTNEVERQQQIVGRLTTLLDQEQPEVFNVNWIVTHSKGVYLAIWRAMQAKVFNGWEEVVNSLDEKWRGRWRSGAPVTTEEERREGTVTRLQTLLEQQQPEIFSPSWIAENDSVLYERLKTAFKKGIFSNWEEVVSKLDSSWQERWRMSKKSTPDTQDRSQLTKLRKETEPREMSDAEKRNYLVSQLNDLLERLQPSTFSSNFIRQNWSGLYQRITNSFSSGLFDSWKPVIGQLDQKWQERWRDRRKEYWNAAVEQEKRDNVTKELTLLLEQESPENFSPSWIASHDGALHGRIMEALRSELFNDWSAIVATLEPQWRERWNIRWGFAPEKERTERLIKEIDNLLEQHQPEIFSPTWLTEHSPRLFSQIHSQFQSRLIKSWNDLISLLEPKWQERWRISPKPFRTIERREKRSLIINELAQILDQQNPSSFNPQWIGSSFQPLLKKIYTCFEDGLFAGWPDLIGNLNNQWQERWDVKWHLLPEAEKKRRLSAQLRELLGHNQPDHFSPFWIEEHNPALYRQIRIALKDKILTRWEDFISTLEAPWPERWQINNRFEKQTRLNSCVSRLKEFLEQKDPVVFNKWWIEQQDKALYARISRAVKTELFTWEDVIDQLEDKWQNVWQEKPVVKTEQEYQEQVMTQLNTLLTEKQPPSFSPFWIQANNGSLYQFVIRAISKNIFKDWNQVISQLPEQWQRKWKYNPRKTKVPDNLYENISEVDKTLSLYKDKLYLLLIASRPEEQKVRDKICKDLVIMAQKGNTGAKDKLVELLYPLVQEWIDQYAQFAVYVNDFDSPRKVMATCIYNYRADGNASFVGYLFGSLKLRAQHLKHQVARSLDAPLGFGDDRTLLDVISDESEEDGLAA